MNELKIYNYQALCNRISRMIKDFNSYPIMPEGDLSVEFIENVFSYNPLFVLDDFKLTIILTLLEKTDYKYSEDELMPLIDETYGKKEKDLKGDILNYLIENFKSDINHVQFKQHSYMRLRPDETMLFYYAYSIFYISKDLNFIPGVLFARKALQSITFFQCEKGTNPIDGIKRNGKLLNLSEFSRDRNVYNKLKIMIENEIEKSNDEDAKKQLKEIIAEDEKNQKGCYIATCVYGSYDCPQVWTLRRYRDNQLAKTWYGRMFIYIYYAISPTLVKRFGHTKWFKQIWQSKLDYIVNKLWSTGIESTPYEDIDW